MTNKKTVSDYVDDRNWAEAGWIMNDSNSCFIGEKYMYENYPFEAKAALEPLARKAILNKDINAWNSLISLREQMAKLLHIRARNKRKAN